MAAGGISAAVVGKWTMKVGTRAAMLTGGAIYGSAWVLTGLGVAMHSLPIVYLGNRELNAFKQLTYLQILLSGAG